MFEPLTQHLFILKSEFVAARLLDKIK